VLPLELRLTVLGVLVLSLLAAYLGPRPRRAWPARRYAAAVWCSLLVVLASLVALLADQRLAAAILVALSVEGLCLAGWLARHRPRDEEPEAEEPAPPPPEGPEEVDWDRFEREFGAYAERRGARPTRSSRPAA